MYKELSKEDEEQLEELNRAVNESLKERREWLDRKMHEYSDLKVGDILYNLETGRKLGKITEIYRYHSDRNPLLDDSLEWNYSYLEGDCGCNNTSSQIGLIYGSKADAIEWQKDKLRAMKDD